MAKKKRQLKPTAPVETSPGSTDVSPNEPNSNLLKYAFLFFGIAIAIAAAYFAYQYFFKKTQTPPAKTGVVTGCQKSPQFLAGLNFGNRASLSTSDKFRAGLLIVEGERIYQHPSWKNAGFLAPIEQDKDGNIFVAPAPFINVLLNPPDQQNTVWRVDSRSQEMTKFLDLPHDAKLGDQNAYGTLDLAYDCDTENLYVSSVYGSTRDKEFGKIYRIDTKTKTVTPAIENTDGFGLGIYGTAKGKRLFYGLSRRSEIWSVLLADDGSVSGTPRKEVTLENIGPRGDDKVRRITFQPNGEMLVFGIEFNFNLIAPTEKQEMIYRFRYVTDKDVWEQIPEPAQVIEEVNSNQ